MKAKICRYSFYLLFCKLKLNRYTVRQYRGKFPNGRVQHHFVLKIVHKNHVKAADFNVQDNSSTMCTYVMHSLKLNIRRKKELAI